LSIVLVGVGLYIRLGILESPVFARLVEEKRVAAAPVAEVLRKNWREVMLTCLLRTGQQAPFYIFWTFVLSYGTTALGFSRQEILNDTLLASGVSLFTVPLWGYVSAPIALYIFICAVISVVSAAALPDRGKADVTVEYEQRAAAPA